ncbi:hypothetical protein [Pyramidobacter piscolens]|uniref:hypothetical protein n=1 Tax=Pyramidobacter piscolens TaxID=638849 RepID=UPI0026E0F926|nr:hypothetical protein [Pyramidobacter piscolens]
MRLFLFKRLKNAGVHRQDFLSLRVELDFLQQVAGQNPLLISDQNDFFLNAEAFEELFGIRVGGQQRGQYGGAAGRQGAARHQT